MITKKYKLGDSDYIINYQILLANIIRIVWQTVKGMTNEILRVKGLK